MQEIDGEAEARRRGRRLVMRGYYLLVAAFILISAGNVTWQVWSPQLSTFPPEDCKTGIYDLAKAVERGRQIAGSYSELGEDEALLQFRGALSPEWERHDAIAASCRSNRELAVALDVIERLRYAEERAVRREVAILLRCERSGHYLDEQPAR